MGQVEGYISEDSLCLDLQNCLSNKIEFLLVDSAADTQNYKSSGFLGLSPRGRTGMPSFLSQIMRKTNYKPVFSFFLNNGLYRHGMFTFNGYDLKKYAKPGLTEQDVMWMDMK